MYAHYALVCLYDKHSCSNMAINFRIIVWIKDVKDVVE